MNEVVAKPFESLLSRYQISLKSTMRIPILPSIVLIYYLLHYRYHEINLNHGRSYIYSPDLTKNKKVTVNPINKDDKNAFNMPQHSNQIMKKLENIEKE